jgi:hypothetical protein
MNTLLQAPSSSRSPSPGAAAFVAPLRTRSFRVLTALVIVLAGVGSARAAFAQDTGGSADTGGGAATGGDSGASAGPVSTGTGATTGGTTSTTTVYTPPVGFPPPGTKLESYLPSSSRATGDTSSFGDGFDLNQSGGGSGVVHGDPNAAGVFGARALRVPDYHVVRRGDTLWDLSDHYLRSPWYWPKLWSYNPQVQNPHWIYPGDHLRMKREGDLSARVSGAPGMITRGGKVPAATVFLRDEGFIDNEKKDVWGRISGSAEDKMLLGDHDVVYLEMDKDHDVSPGEELTIFTRLRSAPKGGAIVKIMGTVKVDAWDKDKRIAKGTITESVDVIERNATVGPVGRRFDVVPPTRNEADVTAHVLVATYPLKLNAQNQVVYIDQGTAAGLRPGNRLFVLRRGDPWRKGLKGSGDLSDKTVRYTEKLAVETDSVRGTSRDKEYPDEIVGELQVLRARENTATCIVIASKLELEANDLAVARKGY